MNSQGKQVVSVATQRSSRALLVTAIFVGIAKVYAVPLEALTVLEVNIPLAAINGAIWAIIGFQLINHLVHWVGDCFNFWAVNAGDADPMLRYNGRSGTQTKLEFLLSLIATLEEEERGKMHLSPFDGKPTGLMGQLSDIRTAAEPLLGKVRWYAGYAKFYFFGWYLVLPIGAGLVALLLPAQGFQSRY